MTFAASPWLAAVTAFVLAAAGTPLALRYLQHRQILDHPNERSSHRQPTPRGGGLAVIPAVLLGWALASPTLAWEWAAMAGAAVLMALSWIDDRNTLPAGPRFLVHAIVVVAGLATLPDDALVFQGALPGWADRLLAGLGWLWFLNVYNFMDGIDGITGVETAAIGIGIALVAALAGSASGLPGPALACAAAGLGFLVWNWHPARIFLGDAGSIPLGFLLGGLLVQLAIAGHLAAALILPAYYLADATITISKRVLRHEKIWQAHRQHFYQRAVQGGHRHSRVVTAILATNLVLIGCAVLTVSDWPWLGGGGAVVIVALLLVRLQFWSRGKPA